MTRPERAVPKTVAATDGGHLIEFNLARNLSHTVEVSRTIGLGLIQDMCYALLESQQILFVINGLALAKRFRSINVVRLRLHFNNNKSKRMVKRNKLSSKLVVVANGCLTACHVCPASFPCLDRGRKNRRSHCLD